ncbi:Uncharacterised protein [Bordetella pertussis]|nr:Uncharacterised protein [Bordetella pertussis]
MLATLTVGVKRGMTITAGTPMRCAWYATPWAWLPADTAITPAARSASVRLSIRLRAPRSLNEAVNCRFSNFSQISAPRISDSVRECVNGVLRTCPRRMSRAVWMAARSITMAASG